MINMLECWTTDKKTISRFQHSPTTLKSSPPVRPLKRLHEIRDLEPELIASPRDNRPVEIADRRIVPEFQGVCSSSGICSNQSQSIPKAPNLSNQEQQRVGRVGSGAGNSAVGSGRLRLLGPLECFCNSPSGKPGEIPKSGESRDGWICSPLL